MVDEMRRNLRLESRIDAGPPLTLQTCYDVEQECGFY